MKKALDPDGRMNPGRVLLDLRSQRRDDRAVFGGDHGVFVLHGGALAFVGVEGPAVAAVDGPFGAHGEEGLQRKDEAFVDAAAFGKILPGGDRARFFVERAADAVAGEIGGSANSPGWAKASIAMPGALRAPPTFTSLMPVHSARLPSWQSFSRRRSRPWRTKLAPVSAK